MYLDKLKLPTIKTEEIKVAEICLPSLLFKPDRFPEESAGLSLIPAAAGDWSVVVSSGVVLGSGSSQLEKSSDGAQLESATTACSM